MTQKRMNEMIKIRQYNKSLEETRTGMSEFEILDGFLACQKFSQEFFSIYERLELYEESGEINGFRVK